LYLLCIPSAVLENPEFWEKIAAINPQINRRTYTTQIRQIIYAKSYLAHLIMLLPDINKRDVFMFAWNSTNYKPENYAEIDFSRLNKEKTKYLASISKKFATYKNINNPHQKTRLEIDFIKQVEIFIKSVPFLNELIEEKHDVSIYGIFLKELATRYLSKQSVSFESFESYLQENPINLLLRLPSKSDKLTVKDLEFLIPIVKKHGGYIYEISYNVELELSIYIPFSITYDGPYNCSDGGNGLESSEILEWSYDEYRVTHKTVKYFRLDVSINEFSLTDDKIITSLDSGIVAIDGRTNVRFINELASKTYGFVDLDLYEKSSTLTHQEQLLKKFIIQSYDLHFKLNLNYEAAFMILVYYFKLLYGSDYYKDSVVISWVGEMDFLRNDQPDPDPNRFNRFYNRQIKHYKFNFDEFAKSGLFKYLKTKYSELFKYLQQTIRVEKYQYGSPKDEQFKKIKDLNKTIYYEFYKTQVEESEREDLSEYCRIYS